MPAYTIKSIIGVTLYEGEGEDPRAVVMKAVRDLAHLCGADLYGAYLKGAHLKGADLYGADLYGANLSEAYLYGANLSEAYLYGANLSEANLSEAYLCGAYLYGANLCGADLKGADLYGAYLKGADLYGAYLKGAHLKGARLDGAKLNWNSHDLIAELLRRAAGQDIEKRKIAGLVLMSPDLCWEEFLALQDPLHEWALNTLAEYVTDGDDAPELLRKWHDRAGLSAHDRAGL